MPETPQLGGLAGLLQSPYLQMALSWLMDSMFSGRGALLKYSNMIPGQSIAANWQRAQTNLLQAQTFGYQMQDQSEMMANRLIERLYGAFGNDPAAARYQAGKAGGRLLSWGVDAFLGDSWNAGLEPIYAAAFGRRAYEAPDGNMYRMRTDYRRLTDTLLTQHFDQGYFNTASFAEIGGIAANLIGSGRYDRFGRSSWMRSTTNENGEFIDENGNIATGATLERLKREGGAGTSFWEQDEQGGWRLTSRSEVIARDVKTYSKALTNLQDVLGGDMNEILDTLDKLFGSNATAMSASRLSNLTSNLRHSMTTTGMSLQQMASMAGTGFAYIAPFGGTEPQGVQMANTAAYMLGAGINVEGVKSDIYGSSILQYQANRLVNGDGRYMAAAYVAFADENNLDVTKRSTYDRFINELGDTPLTDGSLYNWMMKYTNNDRTYINSLLNDERVTDLLAEHPFTLNMIGEAVNRGNKRRETEYDKLLGDLNNELKDAGADTIGSISDLLGGRDFRELNGNEIYDLIEQRLQNTSIGRRGARRWARTFRDRHRQIAQQAFGGSMTQAEAEQTMLNADSALRAQQAKLFEDQMMEVYGDMADDLNKGTAGGIEGLFQSIMMERSPDQALSVADMVLSTLGISPGLSGKLDKGKLRDLGYIKELFSSKESDIAKQYQKIFGTEYKDDVQKLRDSDFDAIVEQINKDTGKEFTKEQLFGKNYHELKAEEIEANVTKALADTGLKSGEISDYAKRAGTVMRNVGTVEDMSKRILQTRMENRDASGALLSGIVKDKELKISGNLSYEAARKKAVDAIDALIKRGDEMDSGERSSLYKLIGEVAGNTVGEEAEMLKAAADQENIKLLLTDEGRRGLKAEVDKEHLIASFVDRSYAPDKKAEREHLTAAVKALQKQTDTLTSDQRYRIANSLAIKDGKVQIDEKKLGEDSAGLTADQITELNKQLDLVASSSQEGGQTLTNEQLLERSRDAVKLTDSNDPMMLIVHLLERIVGKMKD